VGGLSQNITGADPTENEALVRRYYNIAVIALDDLYDSALISREAREELRHISDCLLKRAGDARRLREVKEKEKE